MNYIARDDNFDSRRENSEDVFAVAAFVARDHILVPANYQLVDLEFYVEWAFHPARREARRIGGRKGWFTALKMTTGYKGRLFFPDGTAYDVPDVHDIFVDPDNRWMTNFLKADHTGEAPASPSRLYERVRMISAYCTLRALQRQKLIR